MLVQAGSHVALVHRGRLRQVGSMLAGLRARWLRLQLSLAVPLRCA